MKHIMQGDSECLLVSVAMLADVSLGRVREFANHYAQDQGAEDYITWLTCTDARPFETISEEIALGQAAIADHFLGTAWSIKPNMQALAESTAHAPDLTGKGMLCIYFADESAHAVAYEKGMIYDGNYFEPCTWERWLQQARIYYATQVESVEALPLPAEDRGKA